MSRKTNRSVRPPTRLSVTRRTLGLRQADLAERVGMNKYRVGAIERGDAWPNDLELEDLARALDRPFAEVTEMVHEARSEARERAEA